MISHPRAIVALLLCWIVVGCSRTDISTLPRAITFGSADDQCESANLTNDEDDEDILRQTLDCFFAEVDAGNPVTIDVDSPTVEGDSIYYRYAFDGTDFLLIHDSRLDEYGRGNVAAKRCTEIRESRWLPEGFDCKVVVSGGFAEASG